MWRVFGTRKGTIKNEPSAFSAKAVYVKDWPSTKKKTQGSSLGCSHDATHRVVTKLQAQNDRAVFDSDDELHRTVVHRDEKDEESGAYMKNDDSDDNKKSVDDGRNFRREDDLSTTTQVCHNIQPFQERCRKKCTRQSRKVLWVVLSPLFSKKFERMGEESMYICVPVLRESNKSRFNS